MTFVYTLYGEIAPLPRPHVEGLQRVMARHMTLNTFDYIERSRTLILNAGFDKPKTIYWMEKFLFDKIAAAIPKGKFGRLYFIEGQFFACIFFGHQKWELAEYEEPLCPDWWRENPGYLRALKVKLKSYLKKPLMID